MPGPLSSLCSCLSNCPPRSHYNKLAQHRKIKSLALSRCLSNERLNSVRSGVPPPGRTASRPEAGAVRQVSVWNGPRPPRTALALGRKAEWRCSGLPAAAAAPPRVQLGTETESAAASACTPTPAPVSQILQSSCLGALLLTLVFKLYSCDWGPARVSDLPAKSEGILRWHNKI